MINLAVASQALSGTVLPASNVSFKENSCLCGQGIDRWAYVGLKAEANFWKAQHGRAVVREGELKAKLEQKEAELRLLKQKYYGKSKESRKKSEKLGSNLDGKQRKRGQQKGSKGHPRRPQNLPVIEELIELPPNQQCCATCNLPYVALSTTEDSELIEIYVKGYIRKIKRKKYKRHVNCQCEGTQQVITTPAISKIIKKGKLGVSIWANLLVNKFSDYIPTYRSIGGLENYGISLAQGTITDGFKKLAPLFEPIKHTMIEKSQKEKHWHADETRWEVFEHVEGKATHRWYLWIFQSASVAVYVLDPSRGSSVPEEFFKDVDEGIISCDRYTVYKKVVKKKILLILAFCWAHVRRDFLDVAKSYPKQENWAVDWIKDIGNIYHLNKNRLKHPVDSQQFKEEHLKLEAAIKAMEKKCIDQLSMPNLHDACRSRLESLQNHWSGLIIFVEHSEIPMDNNTAENGLRGPVVGRKCFYGSGSIWAAHLAATMFSIFKTLRMWNINLITWVCLYLEECANNNGNPPEDISQFIPWSMSDAQLNKMSLPMPCPPILDTS